MAGRKKGRHRPRRPARGRRPVKARRVRSRWLWWTGTACLVAATGALIFVVASGPEDLPVESGKGPEEGSEIAAGQTLYSEHCASCHGADLAGQPNWKRRLADGRYPAPPHDETGHTWHHGDEYLFAVTKRGGQATAPPGFLSGMPGFDETLSDAEIWSILDFIKSRWPPEIVNQQRRASSR